MLELRYRFVRAANAAAGQKHSGGTPRYFGIDLDQVSHIRKVLIFWSWCARYRSSSARTPRPTDPGDERESLRRTMGKSAFAPVPTNHSDGRLFSEHGGDASPCPRDAIMSPLLRRVAAFLAARIEQEPGAALGLVDEGLEQARGAGILVLVGELMGLPHRGCDVLVVFHQFAQHFARRDIVLVVVLDGLQLGDLADRLQGAAA